jgi:hypothetical protein
MVTGQVKDTKMAAKGLLGPAIAEFEDELGVTGLGDEDDCSVMGEK